MPTSTPARPSPILPIDILLCVMELCPDVRTGLALASTSRHLRELGASLVLGLPGVRLHTKTSFASFVSFVDAGSEPTVRCRRLRRLAGMDVNLGRMDYADTQATLGALAPIFQDAPNFTSLTIREPDFLRQQELAMLPALPTLRHLHIDAFLLEGASDFARPFPAISHLDVGTRTTRGAQCVDMMEVCRRANEAKSAKLGPAGSRAGSARGEKANKPPVWPSLEHVRGGLLDLWVGGYSCEVNVLEIVGVVGAFCEFVPEVVGDLSPKTLRLSLLSSAYLPDELSEELGGVERLALTIVLKLKARPWTGDEDAEEDEDEEEPNVASDEEEDLDPILRLMANSADILASFRGCRTASINLKGQTRAATARLRDVDHKVLANSIFDDHIRALENLCVRTPSQTTFWRSAGDSSATPFIDGRQFFETEGLI